MKILKILRRYWLTTWALLAAIYILIPKHAPQEGIIYWSLQIFALPVTWISKILALVNIVGDYILYLSIPLAVGIAYYVNKDYLK